MQIIKPVSDLKNYTGLLKEVDQNGMVYLTRNGSIAYAIMTIREADEYERLRTLHGLLSDLDRAKRRAQKEGWISEDEIDKVIGL